MYVEETASICVPLVADFSVSVHCDTASFCDLSTFLPGQGPISWAWNFGDGNTGGGAKPTHVYTTPGTYTVTLTATNASGCQSVSTQTVVIDSPPTPTISALPSPACVGVPVQFNASGTNIISWLWDFNDGTFNGSQNPSHTYLNPNNYIVSLSVSR